MLSILIPVWNKGNKLKNDFMNLANVLKEINDTYEVIIIDDGSVDNTFDALVDIKSRYPHIQLIRLEHKMQHEALLEGFRVAKGDIIITMDADQKVSPKYIPDLLNKINQGYDIVVAWRVKRPGLGCLRKAGSFLINHYTNFVTSTKLHDHGCSLKAYRGKLIRENINRPQLNKFFGIWVSRYAQNVGEIKVNCSYEDKKGSSFNFKKLLKLAFSFIASSANIYKK